MRLSVPIIAVLSLFLTALCSHTATAQTAQPLYPYRIKKGWGFSDKAKQIIIPCIYESVSMGPTYYIGRSKSRVVYYNSDAQPVDSAQISFHNILYDGKELMLKHDPSIEIAEPLSEIEDKQMREFFARGIRWHEVPPSIGWVKDTAYVNHPVPDTITGILKSSPHIVQLRNGRLGGVYDLEKAAFIVPMQQATVKIVSGYFFIVSRTSTDYDVIDLDGKKYKRPASIKNAQEISAGAKTYVIRKDNINTTYDSIGKPQPDRGMPVYEQRVETNRVTGYMDYKGRTQNARNPNPINFYNLNGKPMLQGIAEMTPIQGSHFLVRHRDSLSGLDDSYVYNAATGKKALDIYRDGKELNQNGLLFTYRDTAKKQTHYYSYNGKELMAVTDMDAQRIHFLRQGDMVQRFDVSEVSYDGTFRSKKYTALKGNASQPYTIYDDGFNVVNKEYDRLSEMRMYNTLYLLVNKGGKWGLVNTKGFRQVLPPVYDSIINGREMEIQVVKDGKRFRVDTAGKILFGGKHFDYILPQAASNLRLALMYKPATQPSYRYREQEQRGEVAEAYIIDSAGNVKATWKDPQDGYIYKLTANGNILRYASSETYWASKPKPQLYNYKTGEVTTLDCDFYKTEDYHGKPLFITCAYNEEQAFMLSLINGAVVIPHDKYNYVTLKETDWSDKHRTPGVWLIDNTGGGTFSADHQEELIGFYSLDGIKYWED